MKLLLNTKAPHTTTKQSATQVGLEILATSSKTNSLVCTIELWWEKIIAFSPKFDRRLQAAAFLLRIRAMKVFQQTSSQLSQLNPLNWILPLTARRHEFHQDEWMRPIFSGKFVRSGLSGNEIEVTQIVWLNDGREVWVGNREACVVALNLIRWSRRVPAGYQAGRVCSLSNAFLYLNLV